MPLIKELEDLLLLAAEMDERHQKEAAEELRRIIVSEDYGKGMTREEKFKLIRLDIQAVKARRDARKGK
jgi:hypothetical protein